jgi:hypothetical protein
MKHTCRLGAALATLALVAAPAAAQDDDETLPPEDPEEVQKKDEEQMLRSEGRPWAADVTVADQQAAVRLFGEANNLLNEGLFPKAVETYEQALEHWKHPAIYYNLSLALIPLRKNLEMYAALKEAMKYGAAPLDTDRFDRAKGLLSAVETSIAQVSITTDVDGAEVVMDGKVLFTGPGKWEGAVLVGEHNIVATKPGHLARQYQQFLGPGTKKDIDINLYTVDDLTFERRKFASWIPYAVMGGGAVVGVIGGIIHAGATSRYDDFDAFIEACGGCEPSGTVAGKKNTADTMQVIAISSYVVGLGAVLTGATLAYINRAEEYRLEPAELERRLEVQPMISGEVAGVSATVKF